MSALRRRDLAGRLLQPAVHRPCRRDFKVARLAYEGNEFVELSAASLRTVLVIIRCRLFPGEVAPIWRHAMHQGPMEPLLRAAFWGRPVVCGAQVRHITRERLA